MANALGMIIPPHIGKQGIETVAAWARDTGLAALDLPSDFAAPARVCRTYGLRVGTVTASGVGRLLSPDHRTRQGAVAEIRAQIQAMPDAGATVMFMCLVPENLTQPIADSLAMFKESLPPLVAACETAGVRIAVEGWPGPAPHYPALGCTPEVWRAMFAAVPSAALGLCYDPSHLVRLGIDYLRVLDEFAGRVHHCHGKDSELLGEAQYRYGHLRAALDRPPAFSEGPWRYCIPGDGAVNWAAVAYRLEQIGYDGCVSIELEDARYWGTREKEQQGIIKALKTLAYHFS